jgi:GH24 family phage-related lysozyme (muramidase)
MPTQQPQIITRLIALRDAQLTHTRSYAKLLEIIRIFNEVFAEVKKKLGEEMPDAIEWDWLHESRTPPGAMYSYQIFADETDATCGVCKTADGLALPGDLVKKGYTAPPFHPNCRCHALGIGIQLAQELPGWEGDKGTAHTAPFAPSPDILAFITSYEGFRSSPYYASEDEKSKGIKTIGYGHQITTEYEKSLYLDGYEMSREEAMTLFKQDIQFRVDEINEALGGIKLTQYQFDASLSHYFNTGKLMTTGWWKMFRNGASEDELLVGFLERTRSGAIHYADLYRRRVDEWEIFTGRGYERDYDRAAPEGYR